MEIYKSMLDWTALLSVLMAWLGLLSTILTIIATFLTIVWMVIRLWEWYKGKK